MIDNRAEVGFPGASALKGVATQIPKIGSKAAGALGAGAGAIGGALLSPFDGNGGQQNGSNGSGSGGSGGSGGDGLNTTNALLIGGSMLGAGALIYKMTDDPQQPTSFGTGPTPEEYRNQRRMEMSRQANTGSR